nr:DUF6538 domain-containing protein [Methylopila sp. Yamaguchi]
MLWFRRSVPSDLISRLGRPDIRRSVQTSDFRIARRRASTLVRVVEEAFETLRSAGLGPDARSALAAILDHVMDDFDGDRRRWADRAKCQITMERLAGGGTSRPIVIDGAPKLIMDDDLADLISADTDAFVQAELQGVGVPRRLLPEGAIAATPLIASLGLGRWRPWCIRQSQRRCRNRWPGRDRAIYASSRFFV